MPNKSISPILRKEKKGRFYTRFAHSREFTNISVGSFTEDNNKNNLLDGSTNLNKF
jgi:hypothetical protein